MAISRFVEDAFCYQNKVSMLTIYSCRTLEHVTGDLVLLDNPELKKAEFPALQSVSGGIAIVGNLDEYVTIDSSIPILINETQTF